MLNDFYSKLNDQEKKIFYVALVIVLVMVLDRMFLGPSLSKMKTYDEEIRQQRVNIQRDLRFVTYKNQILEEDAAFSSYYKNTYRTEEQIIASFLKKVEMIATEANINLIKITPAESKERKGFTEYYANLECEGLLENIASFMHMIDTSDDLLKIIKTSFSLKRASGDEVVVNMQIAKMLMGSRSSSQVTVSERSTSSVGSGAASSVSDTGSDKRSAQDAPQGVGSGSDASASAQEDNILNMPQTSDSQAVDENVSQRYQIKGGLFTEKDQKKLQELEAKEPPLKKSVYEKILERVEKSPGSAGGMDREGQ